MIAQLGFNSVIENVDDGLRFTLGGYYIEATLRSNYSDYYIRFNKSGIVAYVFPTVKVNSPEEARTVAGTLEINMDLLKNQVAEFSKTATQELWELLESN